MRKRFLAILSVTILLLAGCSTEKNTNVELSKAVPTKDASVTDVSVAATVAKAIAEGDQVFPLQENTTGKVLIQTVSSNKTYPYNSYLITSSKGETVVVDPTKMPKKELIDFNPVAIVSTHSHTDHTDRDYTNSYNCKKILYTKDDIKTRDFHIYSFASSHSVDTISDSEQNVIVVFEVDGLRIAHMGDIGQTKITDDQMKNLGKIDIAFMQFENSYSGMTLSNEKGFHIIEQLNPTIVIPTHFTDASFPVIEQKYGAITNFENSLAINKGDLPEKKLTFYHIKNSLKYD